MGVGAGSDVTGLEKHLKQMHQQGSPDPKLLGGLKDKAGRVHDAIRDAQKRLGGIKGELSRKSDFFGEEERVMRANWEQEVAMGMRGGADMGQEQA